MVSALPEVANVDPVCWQTAPSRVMFSTEVPAATSMTIVPSHICVGVDEGSTAPVICAALFAGRLLGERQVELGQIVLEKTLNDGEIAGEQLVALGAARLDRELEQPEAVLHSTAVPDGLAWRD